MDKIKKLFTIKISSDQLSAKVWYNGDTIDELHEQRISPQELKEYFKRNRVSFGYIEPNITKVLTSNSLDDFPIEIARGVDKQDGIDGDIKYEFNLNPEVDRSEGWDFREVMKIPTVNKGDILAEIIPPTKGRNGTSVSDRVIKARPGKPFLMRAGKNVTLNKENNKLYANETGQVEVDYRAIHVHTVYEVHGDVTMKTGNINFNGTVIIRGNVPTGFTIQATNDVKIFGLVEAATVISGGSITISEGIAGLRTGKIVAEENIHIGYINQAEINAGDSLFVENSILHSDCVAGNEIICQRGNIIGGTISAGRKVFVKDLGNRMHTRTRITFGFDDRQYKKLTELEEEKRQLIDSLEKIETLQKRLQESPQDNTGKTKITILRLRSSHANTKEKIEVIEEKITETNAQLGDVQIASLSVRGTMYPNVIVSFGKYQRTIDRNFDHVTVRLDEHNITVSPY